MIRNLIRCAPKFNDTQLGQLFKVKPSSDSLASGVTSYLKRQSWKFSLEKEFRKRCGYTISMPVHIINKSND